MARMNCPSCSKPMEPLDCPHAPKKPKTDYRCDCGGYGCAAARLFTPAGGGRPRRFCVHDGNATILKIYENAERTRSVGLLRCTRCKAQFKQDLSPDFARRLRELFAGERRQGR